MTTMPVSPREVWSYGVRNVDGRVVRCLRQLDPSPVEGSLAVILHPAISSGLDRLEGVASLLNAEVGMMHSISRMQGCQKMLFEVLAEDFHHYDELRECILRLAKMLPSTFPLPAQSFILRYHGDVL